MPLQSSRPILILNILIVLFSSLLPTSHARAMTPRSDRLDLPSLDAFIKQIENGHGDQLRGVYVPEILAARIVQQPEGLEEFVSPWQDVLTQFSFASRLGSTALLAHNDLAGKAFTQLEPGQQVYLIYGDGRVSAFIVAEIMRYQAVEPNNTASAFADLENQNILTSSELFANVYDRPGKVVFQTCVENQGHLTWGRLFVIAEPL
jgi:hypothetical protein